MGNIGKKPLPIPDQYAAVDDQKLKLTLVAVADKYDERIRNHIYRIYNDNHLMLIYKCIRESGIYNKGSRDKSKRKILEIPDAYVYDFLTTLFGENWISDNKALHHDLVKPWWVVKTL